MTIISSDLINRYPQTAICIRKLNNIQITKPHVFNVFRKHTGLDVGYASMVLSHRFVFDKKKPIPTIRLEYPDAPIQIKGWGEYPGVGHDILLNKKYVEYFEKDFEDNHGSQFIQDAFNKNRFGLPYGQLATKRTLYHSNMELFLESILLHELVHWGRKVSGLSSGPREALSNDPKEVSEERGWMFVREAYGSYITPGQLGI